MRNKKDLLKLIVEFTIGLMGLIRSTMLLMADTSEYIGLNEMMLLIVAITSMAFINDAADTFRSELTGTPKRFMFGIFDKELP